MNTKPSHKSNTSSYQLMYVGPHSKHRKSLQINSQSTLEWNVSHWDCSPGQSFPAFRLPITLCTRVRTHARQALRSGRGGQGRQHSFAVVFIGLTKPLAFPGPPVPSLCLGFFPILSFPDVSSSFGFTNYYFFLFAWAFLPEWGDGPIVKTIVEESELCMSLSTVCLFIWRNGGNL